MTPEQILRNLEEGCFMTHEEQEEAAEYIRQLQAKREWVGLTDDELDHIQACGRNFWIDAAKIEQLLKDKNERS